MRALWQTLIDLAEAVPARGANGSGLRVTWLTVDAPIAITLVASSLADGGWIVRADVPQWRLPTAFDRAPGRLVVTWEEQLI